MSFLKTSEELVPKAFEDKLTYCEVTLSDTAITALPLISSMEAIVDTLEWGFHLMKLYREKNVSCSVWIFPDLKENRTYSAYKPKRENSGTRNVSVEYLNVELKIKNKYSSFQIDKNCTGIYLAGWKIETLKGFIDYYQLMRYDITDITDELLFIQLKPVQERSHWLRS
ncbi:MAG: hypothetical protein FD155_3359 [Bacteroidetes bacterium]|nr:MAG: hypothetical protein FD155_3359 [Bacteroidota bacterium]